jgi:hypothetical protein
LEVNSVVKYCGICAIADIVVSPLVLTKPASCGSGRVVCLWCPRRYRLSASAGRRPWAVRVGQAPQGVVCLTVRENCAAPELAQGFSQKLLRHAACCVVVSWTKGEKLCTDPMNWGCITAPTERLATSSASVRSVPRDASACGVWSDVG